MLVHSAYISFSLFNLTNSSFYYSTKSSLIRNTIHIISALTTDNCRRIPKFKGAENYWPWAINVRAALESRNIWNIIAIIKIAPNQPEKSHIKSCKTSICSILRNTLFLRHFHLKYRAVYLN